MKPPAFAYHDPTERLEALEILAEYGDEGKVLAGGQSLLPLLNMRLSQPQVLIDINRIRDLQYVLSKHTNGTPGVAFGAITRHSALENPVGESIPLLREATRWVGHPQIRNRGTIGGSIAHADPAAELPTVCRALDGVITVQSVRGSRSVAASDFFLYTFTPAIEPDEMVTEVWLPLPPPRTGTAFLEVARRHGDFALVGVAVSVTLAEDDTCCDVRIALAGAAPTPIRASAAEASLLNHRLTSDLIAESGRITSSETEPTGDVHADAEYRREVAGVLTRRALSTALRRAAA